MARGISRHLLPAVLAWGLIWSSCASQKSEPSPGEPEAPKVEARAETQTPRLPAEEALPAASAPTADARTETRQLKNIELFKDIEGFTLPDLDGKLVSTEDFLVDTSLLIAFWDPDKPQAVEQLEIMDRMLKAKPLENVAMLSVIPRAGEFAAEPARKVAAEKRFDFPILFDKDKVVAEAFYVKETPVFYIVNANGLLVSFGIINVQAVFGQKLTFYDALAMVDQGRIPDRRIWLGPTFCDLVGEKVPDFTLQDRHGSKTYSLSDYFGRMPTVIAFWSTTCPYCLELMPVLAQYYYEKKTESNFEILSIIYSSGADMKRRLDQHLAANPLPYPALVDPTGDTMGRFMISGVPAWAVIDSGGVMQFCAAGFRPDAKDVLDRELFK